MTDYEYGVFDGMFGRWQLGVCTCPAGPDRKGGEHQPRCGWTEIMPAADVARTLETQDLLLGMYAAIRSTLSVDPIRPVSEATVEQTVAFVALLETRFASEVYEPGTIGGPSGERRPRKVDEELVMATLAAMRCIPDGLVTQGCTQSAGRDVKRWLHHASKAAVETIVANRRWAATAMAELDVEQPGDLRVAQLDAAQHHVKEIADA